VCLGRTLDLTKKEWVDLLRRSTDFRFAAIDDVLHAVENYVIAAGLSSEILKGIRGAARPQRRQSSRRLQSGRRSKEDEYATALSLLGLQPGASTIEIESAFRRAVRVHHPDVGGNPSRFRRLVDARNLLLRQRHENS